MFCHDPPEHRICCKLAELNVYSLVNRGHAMIHDDMMLSGLLQDVSRIISLPASYSHSTLSVIHNPFAVSYRK